jgi:Ca-activated chloride channel family protein
MFDYQFQYPLALWLLWLVPVFVLLFILYKAWKRRAVRKMGDAQLVKQLSPDHSNAKEIIKFSLLVLAFACGCIALANPRKPDENSGEARKGIDIVIALDLSNSMKATDIEPDRLSRAKQFISKLIDNLQDDRIGLVVFAGNAYAQMPLTFDQNAARLYVAAADPSQLTSQGTSISDALTKSDLLFGDESDRFRSIIVITDGETHDDNALEEVKDLATKGIMINTVGIGSPTGSTIIDANGKEKRDAAGNVVISKLNEQILQQVAAATNGKYVHLENSEAAVNEILSQFSQIEKKALGDTSLYTYQTFYAWMVLPMLLFLATESFLPDRKKIKK